MGGCWWGLNREEVKNDLHPLQDVKVSGGITPDHIHYSRSVDFALL